MVLYGTNNGIQNLLALVGNWCVVHIFTSLAAISKKAGLELVCFIKWKLIVMVASGWDVLELLFRFSVLLEYQENWHGA